jgi:hypothetical protein
LNKLIKADKTNATEYCVYDYQGNRVRSNHDMAQQFVCCFILDGLLLGAK